MNPEDAAVQSADLANQPVAAFIKDGTVTEIVGTSAVVTVDGGGEARPTILGLAPAAGDRVTMLFDPASNGTCVILGTLGGSTLDLNALATIDDPETTDYLAMVDADDDSSVKALVSDVLALIDLNDLPTATLAATDHLVIVDDSAGDTGAKSLVTDLLKLVYPVGCLYFSTNSTNPATSLGFGTWSAFGAGRVPVGFDSGNTKFDTDEETGGAETVTLALSETPAHDHNTSYNIRYNTNTTVTGAAIRLTDIENITGATGGSTGTATATSNSKGGSGAHNNLQPYIVVRMWKRTA